MQTWITDRWNRTVLSVKLFFVQDEQKRKDLLVAYAMYSGEGRNLLANAMLNLSKQARKVTR